MAPIATSTISHSQAVVDITAKQPPNALVRAPKTWQDESTHCVKAIGSAWYSHVFQLQDTLFHETVRFFSTELRYKWAMVPVTTDCISSPMGLGSDSLPVSVPLFGTPTYLADSQQFLLEYYLRFQKGLAGTYYIAPSFRGEDPDSTHLNQFTHVECELLGDMDAAIHTAERYMLSLIKAFRHENEDAVRAIAGTLSHLDEVLDLFQQGHGALPRITVYAAIELLPSADCWEETVEGRPECGRKVTRKGERWLIKHFGGACWLTEFDHLACPFYQQYTDATRKKAKCADLLIGLGESLGLGERHQTAQEVVDALDHHEVPVESYEWYRAIREVQPMHTSGWGMGSERVLAWVLQHDDIRDLAIVPRLKGKKFLP